MKFRRRYRMLNFWHKFGFWAGVVTFLGFAVGVYILLVGPTKSNQEDMLILLQRMELTNKTDYNRLIRQYPLGYVLFAIDHSETIRPYEHKMEPSEKMQIDWDSMKIVDMTADTITITPPNMGYHIFKNIHIRLSRTPGFKKNLIGIKGKGMSTLK
ncbi:MAG: hypothetical protein ACYS8Z_12900 [Planctomycetota bacterium]